MALIDLKEVLKADGLKPGEVICPFLSKLAIFHAPMAQEPGLEATLVTCVGALCGSYNSCYNLPARPS